MTHETDGAGNTLVTYTHEPGPFGPLISEERGGVTSTHHYDALGSTTFLTDAAGNVTDTFAYDAWGNQIARTGATPTPYTWCGRWGYQDDAATTGGYYIRARSYQPTLARWMSVDPLGPIYAYGIYTYSLNMPVAFYDLTGLVPCCGVSKFSVDEDKCGIYELPNGNFVIGKHFETIAEFKKNDPNKCSCCEFRQYHTGAGYRRRYRSFDPKKKKFTPATKWTPYVPPSEIWLEDRGEDGQPYGHRNSGANKSYDKYYSPDNRANGCKYFARDTPGLEINKAVLTIMKQKKLLYELCIHEVFLLEIVDTCNGENEVSTMQVRVKCSMLISAGIENGNLRPVDATAAFKDDLDPALCSDAIPKEE